MASTSTAASTGTEGPIGTQTPATTVFRATTTLRAATGSVRSCEGFLTLDDPDADGFGECIVTIEDAQQQYYVISGKINAVSAASGTSNTDSACKEWLAANRTFVDDLQTAVWPIAVQPQLDELVAATEFDLFSMDGSCKYPSSARGNESQTRLDNAVFAWRTAIGSPTDI
jgi:hypothetical protein